MPENIKKIMANLGQELRAPVDAITSFARLLCNTDDPVKKRRYADIIQSNSTLLKTLLDDMLDNAEAGEIREPDTQTPHVTVAIPPARTDEEDDNIGLYTSLKPVDKSERPTLLVAEDNESNYFLMSSLLEDDYNLLHAWNGREAVEMFSEHRPDLILMDINMPLMDGYEATRNIRRLSETVPVIAVTAYAFASDRTRIMESGFNSYVSKPVNADRLLSEIDRLLSR